MFGKEVGPYRILQKIGQGGVGIVYKGVHTRLEQEVAIKVLSSQFSQDQCMRERFFREAKIQAKFSHPNVVNILNYLEDDENIFLIMEYVNGETLEGRLKRAGRLQAEKAVSISLSVLEALDFMHSKGVIHRDIKPSNIMFTDNDFIKVTDFGIAKVIDEKGKTRTGMFGTFRYMSPEQILGKETGAASDIYSFGITLYEMVTGRVPFNGDSEYEIMKGHLEEKPLPPWKISGDVSKEFGGIILRAIAKNPKDRYQDIKEVAEDLRKTVKEPKRAIALFQIRDARFWRLDRRHIFTLILVLGVISILSPVKETHDVGFPPSIVSQPNTGSAQIELNGIGKKEESDGESLKEEALVEENIKSEETKKKEPTLEASSLKEKRSFPKPIIKRSRWRIRK